MKISKKVKAITKNSMKVAGARATFGTPMTNSELKRVKKHK